MDPPVENHTLNIPPNGEIPYTKRDRHRNEEDLFLALVSS